MLLPLLLLSCAPTEPVAPIARELPQVTPGTPTAGVAEGFADFPVGAPLGGYTGRCKCFGNDGEYDDRRVAYVNRFNPSVGVQTQPKIAALWLDNGDQDLVLIKTDAIYSFEGIITELEERLGAATGQDLAGKVVLASNHSHSAPANFDQGITWFLGGDRFNREVFERVVGSMEAVALDAWDTREPASIGIGQAKDWDPEDRVYRDRREQNDDTVFFEDIPTGKYKDPYLTVLRVDTATGDPMGMFFAFAIHGTVAGGDNQLWSTEAAGHVETAVEERFDSPVVVGFLQHGGGDASPAGLDREFARMESIGEYAADGVMDLWSATQTSSAPIRLETVTRSIDTRRDSIRVHRDYGVLQYAPYDPSESFAPDEVIYDAQGHIVTPIDEFNTEMGGAFCGEDSPLIPGVSIGTESYPYNSCVEVDVIGDVIAGFFGLDDMPKPLPESLRAKTSATRLGPLPVHTAGGDDVTEEVLLAFFPGETTATYTEQFRRRANAELGYEFAIPFGYSMDHEGYLMTPEDWLLGGYEPNINLWGPLQGEHIMEGLLTAADEVLTTDTVERHDPLGLYVDSEYPDEPLPEFAPDITAEAGTAVTEAPEYMLVPLEGLELEITPSAEVRRVNDLVQFVWEGGDPGVDLPEVFLEIQGEDGSWGEVRTTSGRSVHSPMHDFILSTTADPLFPFDVPQRHTWWLAWQPVSHAVERMGLPLGTYRFHIYGQSYDGGATTWPWPSSGYELTSPAFEIVRGDLSLSLDGDTLTGSLDAPAAGFRLIDMEGGSQGANPVRGGVITVIYDDSEATLSPSAESIAGGITAWTLDPADMDGAVAISVEDEYGNAGWLELD